MLKLEDLKAGVKLRVVDNTNMSNTAKIGDVRTLSKIHQHFVSWADFMYTTDIDAVLSQFELVEEAPKHPHDAMIREWLDNYGKCVVKVLGKISGLWVNIDDPSWYGGETYCLVYPETKTPEQLEVEAIKAEMDKLSKRMEELGGKV